MANLKLAGTYRIQIENSAHQNDDKRDGKDGKVQHDFSLLVALLVLTFTHEYLEISTQTDNTVRYHVNRNCTDKIAAPCSTTQSGWLVEQTNLSQNASMDTNRDNEHVLSFGVPLLSDIRIGHLKLIIKTNMVSLE